MLSPAIRILTSQLASRLVQLMIKDLKSTVYIVASHEAVTAHGEKVDVYDAVTAGFSKKPGRYVVVG